MTRMLSQKLKHEYFPLLIERDSGFRCFYCNKHFVGNDFVYEHLNGKRNDNRIENIVLSCQSCNIKKKSDSDLQIKANEKLKENEDKMFVREKNLVEFQGISHASSEIEINVTNFDIVEQFLTERINTDGQILFSDVLNSSSYLCKKKTGHGSPQAVRGYLAQLTSIVAPFMISKDKNGKKIIVRRSN